MINQILMFGKTINPFSQTGSHNYVYVFVLSLSLLDCTVDGVTGLVEDLEKVLSSEEPLRTNLLHVDTLWSMQSPTSAADWLARLQRKDKENKELEKSAVQPMCVCKLQ